MLTRERHRVCLASRSTLAGALALYLALNVLLIFVLFPSGALRILSRPTAGLVSSTLLANALLFAAVIGFLRWYGGLGADDLGLRRAGLASAFGITFSVWLGVNCFQAAWARMTHVPLQINPNWSSFGVSHVLGHFFGQLFGNALFEEVLFCGVLFRQIRLHSLRRGKRPATALLVGLAISQLIFAVIHVPLRLNSGMAADAIATELGFLFVLGLLLALLYWQTANLYVAIGVHAVSNAPVLVVEQQIDLSSNGVIAAVASLVIMLLWPRRNSSAKADNRRHRIFVKP